MNEQQTAAASHSSTDTADPVVVVPLDGSIEAIAALPVARGLADAEGATVHLVHVSREKSEAADLLDELHLDPGDLRSAVVRQRFGDAADEIVQHATETGSRLIVMSARCRPSEGRGALGTVTREVLRHAPCPVVLVPIEHAQPSWTLRHILLPHDGIPTTAAAIGRATDLAAKSHADLAVLHIASLHAQPGEVGALLTPRYLDQPQYEWPAWANEFMDRLVALGGPPSDVRMRLFFASGEPADAIVQFASEHHTDLVVIAWVAGWEPEQRMTMRKVIDDAPAPLMIFPLEQPEAGQVF